jgi:GT2 family glycosyltransferase
LIAVTVITKDRVHLLRQCVENVLLRTTSDTTEIVIWDNGSTDGTPEYLKTLDDPRVRVVMHPENIGMNGYARGFAMTTAPYLVEVDDDVIDAPEGWDRRLLDVFCALPGVGFLAADILDDPNDTAAHVRHRVRPDAYREVTLQGFRLLEGPIGGACAITSRELSNRVGGFRERPNDVFWLEDEEYVGKLQDAGYRSFVLADLVVHHAGGEYYGNVPAEKVEYWRRRNLREKRRMTVKRFIYRVPFMHRINERFRFFEAPRAQTSSSKDSMR